MANKKQKKQLAILEQGVAAWNKWRKENPDAKIDLRWARFDRKDLSGVNFQDADVRGVNFFRCILIQADFRRSLIGCYTKNLMYSTSFEYSNLTHAIFDGANIELPSFRNAILFQTSWRNSNIKKEINWLFKDTILSDYDVRELLVRGSGQNLFLAGKDMRKTRLVNFDLRGLDLRGTDFRQANFSGADITGVKLWGSAREGWIIDGIRCEYVYWDEAGKVRTPPDRDFRPGEFEELYKQLPSFEYVFAQGFTPLDPLIMDRVVQAINEQHKEFWLELVNFDKRGEPHATFTVCRLDYVEKAKEQITAGYEASKGSPEQQAQLMAAVLGLIENQSKSLDIIKQLGGTANMGDIYNISGGQIGAVGQSASASGNIFQQITPELSRLHEAMRNAAANPAQNAAADEVAKAEQAAKQQNEPKMRQHLKKAGKFAVDCAQKIGAEALSEYLKKVTLGM